MFLKVPIKYIWRTPLRPVLLLVRDAMGYFISPFKVPTAILDMYKQSGNWVTQSNTTGFTEIGFSTKTGSSLPGYIDRIRAGIDATTSYVREDWTGTVAGRYSASTFSRIGDIEGLRNEVFVAYALPETSFNSSDVVNDASNKLKRKLREFTGQSNQLTNVAELRDLPKTIRSVAGSATKLVSTVLNSKRRGTELRKFASDQWLAWSFGVLPTLAAVDDAISSVNDYLARKDRRIKEYGIHSKDWLSAKSVFTTGPYHHNIKMTGQFKHELSCKITAGYKYNLLSSNSYSPSEHLGFSINSIVPTAYELLPYSWLIDYFTTAGSFIEDTFSADFGQSIYLCQNVLMRVNGTVTPELVSVFPGSTMTNYFSSKACKISYYRFTRTPLSNLPRAPLRFKTSDEIAHRAVNKLLNLTSILGSRKT